MADLQNGLPPGWDVRRDERTGKYYYINHYTKTTTWEDPRIKYRVQVHNTPKHNNQINQSESIPLQHGTPELRRNYVYPSQTSPLPAFQIPGNMSPKCFPLQDMRPKMSPLSVRSSKVQDSSLNAGIEKTDELVAKVSAMFPTVSETHIKMLLKKYHSREALVISALQVEKFPITTPGPFATPPPQRNIHQPLHATPPIGLRVCSRGGSPICRPPGSGGSPYGLRSSPRPHSSPKLKLRYMKSIFPQADEVIILDILSNHDNNIQKTSEALKQMGFERKDTSKVAQKKPEAKAEEEPKPGDNNVDINPLTPPRNKTLEEKRRVQEAIQEKYKDVAEHLICIALESVDFDEDKATQILQIMIQENTPKTTTNNTQQQDIVDASNQPSTSSVIDLPVSISRQSLKSLLKTEKELDKTTFSRVVEEDKSMYKSKNLCNTKGPNPDYAKGANEKLLLEDYVKWQGPNSQLSCGAGNLANGPNPSLLSERTYKPCGPNRNLIKGPQCGLAKGSIFSQFKAVVVGESRGE